MKLWNIMTDNVHLLLDASTTLIRSRIISRWKYNKKDFNKNPAYLSECLIIRSSHRSCSIKYAVLKKFAIFTGKHLLKSLFNKVQLFKKRLQHSCFPVNVAKFLRTHILKNRCKRLLLNYGKPIFTKLSKY